MQPKKDNSSESLVGLESSTIQRSQPQWRPGQAVIMVKLWWGCWRYGEPVLKHHQEDSKCIFNKTVLRHSWIDYSSSHNPLMRTWFGQEKSNAWLSVWYYGGWKSSTHSSRLIVMKTCRASKPEQLPSDGQSQELWWFLYVLWFVIK